MGFEPTCPFTDNRISSAARYDHFDTAPCINFVLVSRFLERHSGENRFPPLLRRTPEALILLHFLTVSFLLKPVISSRSRYDHFDTAPYINFDFRPSIFGETFRRETVPSAPPTNPGSIDFTGFFDCELPFEAGDFESSSLRPLRYRSTVDYIIPARQGKIKCCLAVAAVI